MKYPASKFLERVQGPDGRDYNLQFFGENEGWR
jgi:hypothetical protein